MPPTPQQRLQHMTRDLNLTEAQQQQIKPLLESESDQMRTLQQDSSLAPPDRNAKMAQLRQGTNDQIRPILTAEQQKKFDEMQSHRPHRNMQINGTQAPPPPPQ
jgi:Spy/CpxP family protein refolding chaperone